MTAITLDQQIACVRRELAMRKNVYPKWVANGRMKQEAAEKEMAHLQAVHDTLIALQWRTDMDNCPGEEGHAINSWPSFYGVEESTVVRYASDEGEAVALVRARLNLTESRWEPYAWLAITAPPAKKDGT